MNTLANRIGAGADARWRDAFLAAAWRDRVLYGVALLALGIGFALKPITGTRPDYAIVAELGAPVMLLTVLLGGAFLI